MICSFCRKTQSAPGCGMGGLKGKGLVLHGMLIRLSNGWRVQRLAVRKFCNKAGNLFTFAGKHKAHPGAVWEGQRERVCFLIREYPAMRDQTGRHPDLN